MYDLRLCLFYSHIAYIFFLPSVFIFLLFIYKNFSSFLLTIIIIDTITFLILILVLYYLHRKKAKLWLYIILMIMMIIITIRNLYLFISIIYRTMTEFAKKEAIFTDAIDRQIVFLQESQHPVWNIILLKQCCGLYSKAMKATVREYQWFQQTPFSYFCPNMSLSPNQIQEFEQAFRIKYSPQGPCLSILNQELKTELILISISLGFSLLLMLLTWLLIWQDRLSYIELLRDRLRQQPQQQKKESIISTNKSSVTSVVQQAIGSSDLDKLNKLDETKRVYKGYLTVLEDQK